MPIAYSKSNVKPAAGPAGSAATVTPNDATAIPETMALWVGGAGDLALRFIDGSEVTIAGVAAGTVLPFRVDLVKTTGTTATSIVALYA